MHQPFLSLLAARPYTAAAKPTGLSPAKPIASHLQAGFALDWCGDGAGSAYYQTVSSLSVIKHSSLKFKMVNLLAMVTTLVSKVIYF